MKNLSLLKILKHLFHLLPVIFLGIMGVLFPFWVKNGYLNEWYPIIGSFIAIYGGFVASSLWYLQNRKNL